jgi:hypothetical protein
MLKSIGLMIILLFCTVTFLCGAWQSWQLACITHKAHLRDAASPLPIPKLACGRCALV